MRGARRAWPVLLFRLRVLSCCSCIGGRRAVCGQRQHHVRVKGTDKEGGGGRRWSSSDREEGVLTLCLSIISFAMHAGGPVSRNGVPIRGSSG